MYCFLPVMVAYRMQHSSYLSKFAAVALGGLNLREGQCLAIKVEPENLDAAIAVATMAYRRGAAYVDLWVESSRMQRCRIDNSNGDGLSFVPHYRQQRNEEFLRDNWALLSIKSPVDPLVLDGANPARAGVIARAESGADQNLRRGLSNDMTQWVVMAVPSEGWASQVMNNPDGPEALEQMWRAMVPILRLDADDPVVFWQEHGLVLDARAQHLNQLRIDSLHFTDSSGATDLTVGLSDLAVWKGGGAWTQSGIRFAPNIPTEEVFTTPDFRRTTGRVLFSRPVRVFGQLVEEGWMVFSDGVVTDYGATRGRDVLSAFLEVDEGSRRMGEIALVDCSSPIFQSKLLFHNILLDENAACHFALGFAYPTCIRDGASMDDRELDEHGANRSQQHLDFMIGSEHMSISATLKDGTSTEIMRNGQFTL